ncbi:hypothetical protein [Alteraurantiacibacter buctensis]|uniref:Uncharacterized protein n=1 Tax=Alteraurantiacibacter buctensis TaxID=1503981 RepID=A0A844YUP1_9SPHN|nr:hypothetical protein [Alteraurantiacibacter buctensis]MXO70726.1 hypothetical protein [Alteraurantiacibacter buctensis]
MPSAASAQHAPTPQAPPAPDPAGLAAGFDGVLLACESWVLDPTSWSGAEGIAPLVELTGLGARIYPVPGVIDAALPPTEFRRANHFFRVDATAGEGFYLVVSDQVPMCHITGGGVNAMGEVVEQVLVSPAFRHRWDNTGVEEGDGVISTQYRHRLVPQMELVVSRQHAGSANDLVQVVATAQYDPDGVQTPDR